MARRTHKTTKHWALATLAGAAALSTGITPVAASEPGPDALPMSVIAIQTNDADDQAEALSKALRTAVRTLPGWSLAAGDYSLEVLTLSLKCADPPDADCQSRIAEQLKTERFVWGTLSKEGANVRGSIHFWTRGKGTTDASVNYSANLTEANDDALRRIAEETMTQLTGGPPKGPLHVRAGTGVGQVFVDGQPVGALQAGDGRFFVPTGPHRVTVKASNYLDVEGQVAVNATTGAEIALTMVPDSSGRGVPPRVWFGAGALALGVVAGVTGIVSSVQVNDVVNNPRYTSFRQANPQSSDVCGLAASPTHGAPDVASLCNTGKTFQAMQIVAYPLAAVAAGVGVYLLATVGKPAPKASGLRLNPQLNWSGASLDLSYDW